MSSLNEFCSEFGLSESDLGVVARNGRRVFLVRKEDVGLAMRKDLFGIGIFLGEEKAEFMPSPALLELIAARTRDFKAVVDEKAAWLFLCGRDILEEGALRVGEPTSNGLFLVQNTLDENLGFGRKKKGVTVKNLMDRGFYLRRERS